ncbi:MAG: hypothetical protein K8S20_13110 [Chloroflexi bacterium]|nr:hypothetical protein [Chloroflexota bacterium]
MYTARVAGPQILNQLYVIDTRPLRALIMIPLYMLFHGAPFYYALSAYLFRAAGALTMLWMLRLVWPAHKKGTFLTALLFLVYPGFLSQPTPVDFQSHFVGVWLAYFSIGLSIKSVYEINRISRLLLWLGSALSGWIYLGQMEYYIGFEIVRFLLILMILMRETGIGRKSLLGMLKSWLPYAIIPFVFLFWRLFIFEGERKSTDVGAQLAVLVSDPIHTILTWLVYLLQDAANVTVLAWTVPLSQMAFDLRLRESAIALGLSLLVLILVYAVLSAINGLAEERSDRPDFAVEGIWVGAAWVVAGLVFVILANRHVVFPEYSRYGFVSAGGAAILIVALISWVSSRRLQMAILGCLLVSATATHYANATRFANSVEEIRSFWWQVSWRVPNFEPGTTIIAHYPSGGIRETSFVWGPANQIYFPEGSSDNPFQTGISAMLLDRTSVLDVLSQRKKFSDPYSLVQTYPDPSHILILTQPGLNSCVQVIDGNSPVYSTYEDPLFFTIGSHSEPDHIRIHDSFQNVPESLLGQEPEHTWCYFYEKASLARQQGDWEGIVKLGLEASREGERPNDLIEWLPFLEAYALTGHEDLLAPLSSVIRSDKYVARQVCSTLGALQDVQDHIKSMIDLKYCKP